MPHKLSELNAMSESELRALGEKLNIKGAKKMDLAQLGFTILDTEAIIESQKPTEPKPAAAKKRGRPKKEAPKADAKPAEQPKPEEPKPEQPKTEQPKKRGRKPKATEAKPVEAKPEQLALQVQCMYHSRACHFCSC